MTNPKTFIDAIVDLLQAESAVTNIVPSGEIKAYHDVVNTDGDRDIQEYIRNMTAPAVLVAWERTGSSAAPSERIAHQVSIIGVFETEGDSIDFVAAVHNMPAGGTAAFYFNPRSVHENITRITAPEFERRNAPKDQFSGIDYLYAGFQISERC